ncbi:MAG: cysteine hydrolase [Acholeplasmataceae bacterium]|nr:cysteine hydrolase [Acholeplasmataceae bacterium]
MNKTALIIVDMLHDFAHPDGLVFYPKNQEILPAIQHLLTTCRVADFLIIFMQQRYRKNKPDRNLNQMRPCCIEGSGGEKIVSELTVDHIKDYIIPKRRFSSFYGTDLDLVLREHGIKRVIIVGTKTNCCINATVLDAHYLAYDVVVVRDCVGTSDDVTNEIYLRDMERYLCDVLSLEETVKQIKAGHWS